MPTQRTRRSRSRQTTPQSPPKQTASHVSPKQSRQDSRRNLDSGQPSIQRKKPETPLPVVDEVSDASDDIEVAQLNFAPDSELALSGDGGRDVSDDDDFDRTSSNDTTQLDSLDNDLIIDTLPTLYQASSRVLSFIDNQALANFVEDVGNPLSKTSKRLGNLVNLFHASREAFGIASSYIDPELIVRKLSKSSDVGDGPWKPDAVLQLSNLSLLVAHLLRQDETSIYDTLERMFNTFPEPFGQFYATAGPTKYSTQLASYTTSVGIALRIQFFLKIVDRSRSEATFDPNATLDKVFFDDDGKLNGFHVGGKDITPETESMTLERVQTVRNYFRKSSKNPIDLARLKSKFPWSRFLMQAFRWISLRKQELDAQIAAQGGIIAIQERLEQNDFAPYIEKTIDAQATPGLDEDNTVHQKNRNEQGSHHTPPRPRSIRQSGASTMAERVTRFKQVLAQEEEASDSQSDGDEDAVQQQLSQKLPLGRHRSAVEEISQSRRVATVSGKNEADDSDDSHDSDDSFVGGGGDDDDVNDRGPDQEEEQAKHQSPPRPTQSTIVPTQKTLDVLEVARQQARLGNKENINIGRRSYIDKQPTAQRLGWDDSQSGQKRARESPDEDDESDQFELDTRQTKRQRLPRPPPAQAADDWLEGNIDNDAEEHESPDVPNGNPQPARSTPQRPPPPPLTEPLPRRSPLQNRSRNIVSHAPSSSAPQPRQTEQQPPPTISSRQSTPAHEPPQSSVEAYREVREKAKQNVTMRSTIDVDASRNPRFQQPRRPWTPAELNRLFDMIAQHGCAWAHILAQDLEHPEGPALQQRGQVQLKDKARNLKMDYLKAGTSLPPGFSGVSIKSADKDLLNSLGLPYE